MVIMVVAHVCTPIHNMPEEVSFSVRIIISTNANLDAEIKFVGYVSLTDFLWAVQSAHVIIV